MNFNDLTHPITLLVMLASSTVYASQTEIVETELITLPSSRSSSNEVNKFLPKSLVYLNDAVKNSYNTMRNGVIKHVTKKVALSLFNFSIDGFAPENLATYVSNGTKPFLPFEFANGVKITKVTPKGKTIIYRAEMPITKNHRYAEQLALVGKDSATTIVCNDSEIVDGLLERGIVIQYDYYDSNGIFFSSFTI